MVIHNFMPCMGKIWVKKVGQELGHWYQNLRENPGTLISKKSLCPNFKILSVLCPEGRNRWDQFHLGWEIQFPTRRVRGDEVSGEQEEVQGKANSINCQIMTLIDTACIEDVESASLRRIFRTGHESSGIERDQGPPLHRRRRHQELPLVQVGGRTPNHLQPAQTR